MTENLQNLFNYPFEAKELFTKRKLLRKQLRESLPVGKDTKRIRIAIAGGSTTSDLVQVLELMFLNAGIDPEFYESDYNRYAEEISFAESPLWAFKPDVVYIHTNFRNLNFSISVEDTFLKFKTLWEGARKHSKAIFVQNNFELPPFRTSQNLELSDSRGKAKWIQALNAMIASFAAKEDGFYVNDINYLSSFLGLQRWFDNTYWYNYKYPYSTEATVYVAKSFSNILFASLGKSKKCLVLDLDNTLWGGVIGDDGLNGIALGEGNPTGEAYLDFQKYLKDLKSRGVILAVCSKNESEIARSGFTHPDSILKLEDFASFQASWGVKTDALKRIAAEINIGLDSLVFIDDNPAERQLIRDQLPMVAVPEVGSDVAEFSKHIDQNGYFETVKILQEDIDRNSYYADNKVRQTAESEFANYSDFLTSLSMEAEIKPFNEIYLDRITQLINKTNQFNLTTRRVDTEETRKMIGNPAYVTLYARLKDKFGDNGLVSLISAHAQDKVAVIDHWVMSCRVFKRDLELAVFDQFVQACMRHGITTIEGAYLRTEKNNVVAGLYSDLGFEKLTDTTWRLSDLKAYQRKNKVIAVS